MTYIVVAEVGIIFRLKIHTVEQESRFGKPKDLILLAPGPRPTSDGAPRRPGSRHGPSKLLIGLIVEVPRAART